MARKPLVLAAVLFALASTDARGQAIIDNGTVQLGINATGELNVPGPASAAGTTDVGLRFVPTNYDATAAGCACEGWGAADALTGATGYANVFVGSAGLTPVSFTATASTAVSVTDVGSTLRVTHDYHPAATPNLYEATVTIENISADPVDARYRRVMDWDIEPTQTSEFVTIAGTATTGALIDNDNDGFATANPLGDDGDLTPLLQGDFTDVGPRDHGARFDFGFGLLDPGDSVVFRIYYGAAATETQANVARAAVGTELYSYGQPSTEGGPTAGTPNTFTFGFAGVGGEPLPAEDCDNGVDDDGDGDVDGADAECKSGYYYYTPPGGGGGAPTPTPTPTPTATPPGGGGTVRPPGGEQLPVTPVFPRPSGTARQPKVGGRSGRTAAHAAQARRKRIRVRLRGRLTQTAGRSCQGRVRIVTRVVRRRGARGAGRVVARRRARMGADCRFTKRYAIRARALPKRLRARKRRKFVRVKARFGGNARLRPAAAPRKTIRVRRR